MELIINVFIARGEGRKKRRKKKVSLGHVAQSSSESCSVESTPSSLSSFPLGQSTQDANGIEFEYG